MTKLFGLSEKGEVLGLLYFGHPTKDIPAGKRKHISEVTLWLSSEQDFDKI
jgi:hypothetical protein